MTDEETGVTPTPGPELADRVVSDLAHQVRTPLALIVGYAELLTTRDDPETRETAPQRILDAADRLSDAVDDLLILFALDAGWLLVDRAPLPLRDVAEAAVAAATRRFPGETLDVELADGAWPVVAGDTEHVSRIIRGLVATLARLADGGTVLVLAEDDGRFARVSVRHDGVAISGDRLENLFERYGTFALSNGGATRGGSLELYNARRLVELHGGAVGAEAAPGGGTVLTFTLPLAPQGEA